MVKADSMGDLMLLGTTHPAGSTLPRGSGDIGTQRPRRRRDAGRRFRGVTWPGSNGEKCCSRSRRWRGLIRFGQPRPHPRGGVRAARPRWKVLAVRMDKPADDDGTWLWPGLASRLRVVGYEQSWHAEADARRREPRSWRLGEVDSAGARALFIGYGGLLGV